MKTYIIWTLVVWLAAILIKAIWDEESWPQTQKEKLQPTLTMVLLGFLGAIPVWIVEDFKVAVLYLLMLHAIYLVLFDLVYNAATNKFSSDRPKVNIFYIGNTAIWDRIVRWCIRELKGLFGGQKTATEPDFFWYWLLFEVPYSLLIFAININYHFDGTFKYDW